MKALLVSLDGLRTPFYLGRRRVPCLLRIHSARNCPMHASISFHPSVFVTSAFEQGVCLTWSYPHFSLTAKASVLFPPSGGVSGGHSLDIARRT